MNFDDSEQGADSICRKAVEPQYREARTLRLPDHPVVRDVLEQGTRSSSRDRITHPLPRISDSRRQREGRRSLRRSPQRSRTLGLIALVWVADATRFSDYEVQLLNGISSQMAMALEKDRLAAEVMRLKRELNDARAGERIIGSSPKIRRAIEMALSVADSQTTVLLQGESGTGKELVANLIQFNSRRNARPFIKINCGAIPQTLLETELFGHERGAFTDARSRRIGRFEEADGGTFSSMRSAR